MDSEAGAATRPLSVAHIGAFSMPNWGDKLYPDALQALCATVGLPARFSHYCPVPGVTSSGERIRALRAVRDSGAEVAFVGGGDVLRFDNRTVAMDHLSVPTGRRHTRVNRLRARWFAKRHFLPGPGVWAPLDQWLTAGPSVLLSAGVHTVPATADAQRAVSNYRAAWVRTHNGAERLSSAGVDPQRIVVAPDMIFAIPDFDRRDAVIARGHDVFRNVLGMTEGPLLFHAAQFHGWPPARVRAALESLKGLPVATVSLGSYAGEDRVLRAAAGALGIPSLDDLTADDITAVLAAAGAVFSTSMHAAIVGASFGTPVLVPGIGKTRDAFAVCPEPPKLRQVEDATLRATTMEVLGTRVAHSVEANREAVVGAFAATLRAADLR